MIYFAAALVNSANINHSGTRIKSTCIFQHDHTFLFNYKDTICKDLMQTARTIYPGTVLTGPGSGTFPGRVLEGFVLNMIILMI